MEAMRFVERCRQVPRVAELARELGVSTRYLRREFRRAMGVTPKRVLDERRVRRAFCTLYDSPRSSGAEVAAATGFFDQAHFIRAIKGYTGYTPATLPRRLFAFARTVS